MGTTIDGAGVDPYTDIVLSACCTASKEPNAAVIDHGRTLVALRRISRGEELITHRQGLNVRNILLLHMCVPHISC